MLSFSKDLTSRFVSCGSDQKCRPQVHSRPAHLFHLVNELRGLDGSRISSVVTTVIQINVFFFVLSENVQLAKISDERPHVRDFAWRKNLEGKSSAI